MRVVEKVGRVEPAETCRRRKPALGMGRDDGHSLAPAGQLEGKRCSGDPGTDDQGLGHAVKLARGGRVGNGLSGR